MACLKPLIVITGEDTPLYNFLKPLNCSVLISQNRNEGFVDAINDLIINRKKREQLAQNGYDTIKNITLKIKLLSST